MPIKGPMPPEGYEVKQTECCANCRWHNIFPPMPGLGWHYGCRRGHYKGHQAWCNVDALGYCDEYHMSAEWKQNHGRPERRA